MKYMGSKERIADEIVSIILSDRKSGQYVVDAFCGSLAISQRIKSPIISNDNNKYLVAMWKSLQAGKQFKENISKEYYADVRNSWHNNDGKYGEDEIGWVGFMASYNGRFFDGGYSGHNVMSKNGKSRDYISEQIKNTKKQIPYISHISFTSGSYDEIDIPENSIIYCDIPYRNTKQYSTSAGFDYEKFYDWCRNMSAKGHRVFISEYWMPDDFNCIWQKEINNTMNQSNTYKPVEKLFTIGDYNIEDEISLF